MAANFKIQPLSYYIKPLYEKWSQSSARADDILCDFQETISNDFDEINAEKFMDGYGHGPASFLSSRDYRSCHIDVRFFRCKKDKEIFAAIFDQKYKGKSPECYIKERENFYRIYDTSPRAKHPNYLIHGHDSNIGELIGYPVTNDAPYIAVAENGLIMVRSVEYLESQIAYMADAPILKL